MQIKKVVIKEEQDVVEISKDELVKVCAEVCKHIFEDMCGDDDESVDDAKNILSGLTVYSALLIDHIFENDNNDESEEN